MITNPDGTELPVEVVRVLEAAVEVSQSFIHHCSPPTLRQRQALVALDQAIDLTPGLRP